MSTMQDKVVEWARTPAAAIRHQRHGAQHRRGVPCHAVEDPLQRDRGTGTATEPQHKKVVITLALDGKDCGAKHYAVQHDGSIAKVTHSTSSGIMLVLECTVADAATLTRPSMYAICSVPKDKPIDAEAWIDYGVSGTGAPLTRSGKHFEFRAGVPGMMVFDLDPKGSDECFPELEYKDPAAYHAALVGICPELGNADAVSHPSGSHGDVTEIATGKVVRSSFGTHCRVAVKDQDDIPRAMKVAHERAMLAGHLHVFVDKAGHVHLRSIVDAQLGAVARPVFSCPAVVPQGYELRNRPALIHHYGGYLDTKVALPDLPAEQRKKLDAKTKEAERDSKGSKHEAPH